MLSIILALGIPSEMSALPANRPKIRIVTVGVAIACAIAYYLPELDHPSESYFLGPLAILGFTVALLYFAISEIMSSSKANRH